MAEMSTWQRIVYILTYPITLLFVSLPNAVDAWFFKFQSRKFRLTRPNCLFLINPSSGAKIGEKIMKIVKSLNRPEDIAVDIFSENVVQRVRQALSTNSEAWHLIVCGGDGTISTVVDKMENELRESERDRIIYIPMPLGTGNDMARTMGFTGKVGLNFVNKFFNRVDSPKTFVKLMDRWNFRVLLPAAEKPMLEKNWMLYLGIGYDGNTSYLFDQMRKKIPWFFKSNTVNKFFYAVAYSYMLLRNFFGRKKGDLFLGGSIDVQPNPRALEPFPKQRKLNPGDKLDISKWGNILFQNAFSFSSGIMNIWLRISGLLTKLRDPDTLSLAERELKTLIVNEIDDGDKLATMISCIGDHSESSSPDRRGKQTHLCLFIAIAETFQHQILEYLPKVFSVLNRRIREGDLDASESVSESYGGVFEFAFKGTEREEALSTFRDSVKPLLDFIEKGSRNSQSMAATALTKVVQNCQIFLLEAEFDWVFGQLLRTLQGANCRATFNLLEAVLSLLLSQKERVSQVARALSAELSRLIGDEDWRVRKICFDLFYSMLVIDGGSLSDFPSNFQEVLLSSKGDKSKPVREAAMECLKLVNSKGEVKGDQKPENRGSNRADHRGSLREDFRGSNREESKGDYKLDYRAETPKKSSEAANGEKQRSKRNVITNQKMNLDHVQPTIKRARLNSDFSKQKGIEITQVLVKEPRVKINYEEFMAQNDPPPIEREIEKSSRVFEDPEPKKSEVLSGQNFETFQPPRDSTEKELTSLKKYIKVLNGKFKELQGNFVEVQRSNAMLLQKVEGLQRSVYQLSMISESRIPEKQERKIEFSGRNLPTKGVNDSLFAVLSLGEGPEAQEALLGFLRVSKHFSALDTIEKTLLDKLIFRLMRLSSEGFQGDFVLGDYALRWLGGCLDRTRIREPETLKKLQALLLFLVASLDDEDTKQAALRLSKHPAFRGPAAPELFDPHEFVQGEHNLSRELDM